MQEYLVELTNSDALELLTSGHFPVVNHFGFSMNQPHTRSSGFGSALA